MILKKNNENSLGDVLKQLFDAYGWTEKMDSVRIINSWEKIVGGIFAKHTTNLYVKNKKLYVILDSSVLRNELYMERSTLVKKLNNEIGKKVIDEIIFS
jgi:predicted nucleic acid-binding Zn ribbon protein